MITRSLAVQNHTPDQVENLSAFLDRYRAAYPDAKLISAGFYTYHPAYENGANVFCVLDGQGQMRGFAPIASVPVGDDVAPNDPHHIWTILLADPGYEGADRVRRLLLDALLARVHRLAANFPVGRPTRLASDMMISQREDIAFLEQNGFARYDGVYVMQRALLDILPPANLAGELGLTLRHSKLASEAEQQQYLSAFNRSFPDNPKNLETFKFLLDTPGWATGGSAIMAFHQDDLIASILTYPGDAGSEGPYSHAMTDDVFVLPAWRGRGIAKALIADGLKYTRAQGFTEIILEVKQSNAPAIAVYQAMGYKTVNEEVFLGRYL